MVNPEFWQDKKVFVTGHTGFKGSWLCLLLRRLGAEVTGYSLSASTSPNLYQAASVEAFISDSVINDIRNFEALSDSIQRADRDYISSGGSAIGAAQLPEAFGNLVFERHGHRELITSHQEIEKS